MRKRIDWSPSEIKKVARDTFILLDSDLEDGANEISLSKFTVAANLAQESALPVDRQRPYLAGVTSLKVIIDQFEKDTGVKVISRRQPRKAVEPPGEPTQPIVQEKIVLVGDLRDLVREVVMEVLQKSNLQLTFPDAPPPSAKTLQTKWLESQCIRKHNPHPTGPARENKIRALVAGVLPQQREELNRMFPGLLAFWIRDEGKKVLDSRIKSGDDVITMVDKTGHYVEEIAKKRGAKVFRVPGSVSAIARKIEERYGLSAIRTH